MTVMQAVWVYITAKNVREAKKIGRELVRSRLTACANILEGMQSVYRWKDKMEEARETVLIVKTRFALADKVIRKVKAMHSYSCPCVIVLPIVKGNPDYLRWIMEETMPSPGNNKSR